MTPKDSAYTAVPDDVAEVDEANFKHVPEEAKHDELTVEEAVNR